MIPKIIHLCWLSGDPFPPEIQKCLDSWKEHLGDYEVWLWDSKRFDVNSSTWTRQAFENKKYAFAADYIRFYVLYNYGGIYLDSDVLVYKNFDELLSLPYFIGHDQIGGFEAAVIGAEKGCRWIKDVLDYYEGRSFVQENGVMDVTSLPVILHHRLLEKEYHFRLLHQIESYAGEEKWINVFDGDFFNSRDAVEVRQTKRSFCAHNYAGSWTQPNKAMKERIKSRMPIWLLKYFFYISHHTWAKHKFDWYTIPFEG